MIEIQGLCKYFGERQALKDVSFSVSSGQIAGFLGSNGAGKTTTLDILTGCIGADKGTAQIGPHEISQSPLEVKKSLGYLPDDPPLHLDMTVTEFLKYVGKLRNFNGDDLKRNVQIAIEKLSLTEVQNRIIGNLSKGFKQRVGLAHAILHNPKVLILDEPTEGLDPQQIRQTRDLINDLKGEHTILFSSHILSEVENICDVVIVIDKGKIIAQGPYDELIKSIGETSSYLIKVHTYQPDLALHLKNIEGVITAKWTSPEKKTIECKINRNTNAVDQVALHIIESRAGLVELSLCSKKLEEVYFQLTETPKGTH